MSCGLSSNLWVVNVTPCCPHSHFKPFEHTASSQCRKKTAMPTNTRARSNYAVLNNYVFSKRYEKFHDNNWGARHYDAWHLPSVGSEHMIVSLINGWAEYADSYHKATSFEPYDTLKEDYFAGENWLTIAGSILQLLSMDLGRLDGGTLNTMIHEVLRNEGFEEADLT